MADRPVVVVGAGLGGLATALRLAHRGERVIVVEKTDQVGGRNRSARVGACQFDVGPTLMMMLDPFRKLFADVGERIEDRLDLRLCDPSYRVFFADGSRLDATTNVARMVRRIEDLAGREEALRYPQLLGELAALYREAIPLFVERNYRSPLDLAAPGSLWPVMKHRMLGNLGRRIERYVRDPRLRMTFSFQSMYLGLSPYEAPWVYAVLAYMECGEGIWYPMGGLSEISRAVARSAASKGVEIRLSTSVSSIEGSTAVLASGERIEAKAIVCNADLPYAERELVRARGRHAPKPCSPTKGRRRFSCSTYMLYIDYEGELPELEHHNVFFGGDFKGNLDAIFRRNSIPDDPAFYACVSARTDSAMAPKGHENLYVLVPCPNLERPWTESGGRTLLEAVFARLTTEVGFDRRKIVAMKEITPLDWQNELNLERGAAFGLSHRFSQSACFRPSNHSRHNRHVYYVGASTVPGNGLPMVLISADLAVQRMAGDGILG